MKSAKRVLICSALAGWIAAGCGSSVPTNTEDRGSVSLDLTSTKGATVYKLVDATFEVTGRETHTLTPTPDDATFSIDLPTGRYNIRLKEGWHIESSTDDGLNWTEVNAVLESPESQDFSINAQAVTYVQFTFRAGPDVMKFGDGRLGVGIEVHDASDSCAVTPSSTCGGTSTITCSGHTAAVPDSCLFSTGPSGTTVTCSGTSTTLPSGFGVAPNGYGDIARELGELQRRLLEYFESHGRYPVATQAPTPAATCCSAGGGFQCPVNAAAWTGTPTFPTAWDMLGFSKTTAHSFVYSYAGSTGDDAQLIATGDLDCDGTQIDFRLVCTSTNGNPSCVVHLPVACTGVDYE